MSGVIVSQRIRLTGDAQKGKFLPLAVLVAMGHDGDRIEQRSQPEDIEDHPVLGMTYRVHIHETTDPRKRESIVRDVRNLFLQGPS